MGVHHFLGLARVRKVCREESSHSWILGQCNIGLGHIVRKRVGDSRMLGVRARALMAAAARGCSAAEILAAHDALPWESSMSLLPIVP
jgi:hypothetical protein